MKVTPTISAADIRAAAIRKVVRAIKRGSFMSYGEVARRAGLPKRARLVGQVLRDSGDDARLPWHRVTGAGGRIAFPAGSANAREQLRRLAREGVEVRGSRVMVKRTPAFAIRPPSIPSRFSGMYVPNPCSDFSCRSFGRPLRFVANPAPIIKPAITEPAR